ncbi:MAG: hypothetical protein CL914_10335 [Deltaproteobacteria bacterium]|nr:hypothetical protein [Deltaproteobacteria bacterium]
MLGDNPQGSWENYKKFIHLYRLKIEGTPKTSAAFDFPDQEKQNSIPPWGSRQSSGDSTGQFDRRHHTGSSVWKQG